MLIEPEAIAGDPDSNRAQPNIEQDTTEYLLSNPANRHHLMTSIEQASNPAVNNFPN